MNRFSRWVMLHLVVVSFPCMGRAEDWPQFLGPRRDGASAEKISEGKLKLENVSVLWRRDVGGGFSGPVVAGNRLILFHQIDDREVLECMNAGDGKTIWSSGVHSSFDGGMFRERGPRATPVIAGGRVFAFGGDATLQCVDLDSGKPIWIKQLGEEFTIPQGYFGPSSSPLVEDGRVIVQLGGNNGAGIVALDAKTGEIAWQAVADEASYSSPIMAVVSGRRVLLCFARTGLFAVDPQSGKELAFFRWRARIDASVNAATPIIVDNHVFISSSYGVGAALLELGDNQFKKIWSNDGVLSAHYNSPVLFGGNLYGIDGRQEGGARLVCLNAKTGKLNWSNERFGCAALLLATDRLLILTEKGELILANARADRFDPIWRKEIVSGVTRAHPALSNGLFFARSQRELVCVDLR